MEEEAVLVCYCGQELAIGEVDSHMRSHVVQAKLSAGEVAAKSPSGFVDPCTVCGKLMQRGSLLRHMNNVHPGGGYAPPSSSAMRAKTVSPVNGGDAPVERPAREQQERRKTLLTSRKKLAAVAELDAVTASESHSEDDDDEEEDSSDSDVSVVSSPEPPAAAPPVVKKKMGRPRKDTRVGPPESKKKRQNIAPPIEEEDDPFAKNSRCVEFVCSKQVVATGTCSTRAVVTRLHRPLVLLPSQPALLLTKDKVDILLQPHEPNATLRAALDQIFHQVSSWPEANSNQQLALVASRIQACFYRTVDHLLIDLHQANPSITAKLRTLQQQ